MTSPAAGSPTLIFGKYEVIRRLAVGGMGEVFLARQIGLVERLVILKNLLPDLASQEGFVDQFLDEARVAATLNHPNIVAIFEVGMWEGVYYIAMEYIPGENLARIQKGAGKQGVALPWTVSARVMHDAALGLDHAHKANDVRGQPLKIVHRDISPHNIMVRGDGVTKVVDFGIAKAANKSSRTATGMLKGKFPYMSPEQVLGKELDGRSDQFSLGIVLWELCTSRRLFTADREIELLKKVLQEPILPPSQVVPGVPPELDQCVMRMLNRDVGLRYPTLNEAAADLRLWLESQSNAGGAPRVAAFIQKVVGDDLREIREGAASHAGNSGNFMISLRPTGADASSQSRPLVGPAPITGSKRSGTSTSAPRFDPAAEAAAALASAGSVGAEGAVPIVLGGGGTQQAQMGQLPVGAPAPGKKNGLLYAGIGAAALLLVVGGGVALLAGGSRPPPELPKVVEPPPKTPGTVVAGTQTGPEGPVKPPVTPPVTPPPVRKIAAKVAASSPGSGSSIRIDEPVGATIFVDGKPWKDKVPTEITGLPAGPHALRLVLADGKVVEDQVEMAAGPPLLLVGSAPQGATVKIAGMVVGKTPLKLQTLPAAQIHSIVLELAGYQPATVEVELKASETRELSVPLLAKEKVAAVAERPAGEGLVTLDTEPFTKITIDGKRYGTTPLFKQPLAAGKHTVLVENEDAGIKVTRQIEVKAGEALKLRWKLP